MLAETFEQQLGWLAHECEQARKDMCAAGNKVPEARAHNTRLHMLLSLAESVKLAKEQHSKENDRTAARRIGGQSDQIAAKMFLEFTGPKSEADAFLDGESYAIEIGKKKFINCRVRARRDLGVDGFWAVEFNYGLAQ